MEISDVRGALVTGQMQSRFKTKSLGFVGEQEAHNWLSQYGSQKWHLIYDYWFAKGNNAQIDLLLLTNNTLYIFEIKNYNGFFVYQDGVCYLNKHEFSDNIMTSMKNKIHKMTQIFTELPYEISIQGALVFMNEHCHVEVDDCFDFEIIMRNQFRNYIYSLKQKPHTYLNKSFLNDVNHLLSKYRVDSPFKPNHIPIEVFSTLPKGVTCQACQSFDTEICHKTIRCNRCSFQEKKAEAIIRTAIQLRYIFYYEPRMITTRNVAEFMGGGVSVRSVRRVLSRKFKRKGLHTKEYYLIDI